MNEIADVLEMIRNVVDTASERLQKSTVKKGPGHPPVPSDNKGRSPLLSLILGEKRALRKSLTMMDLRLPLLNRAPQKLLSLRVQIQEHRKLPNRLLEPPIGQV